MNELQTSLHSMENREMKIFQNLGKNNVSTHFAEVLVFLWCHWWVYRWNCVS